MHTVKGRTDVLICTLNDIHILRVGGADILDIIINCCFGGGVYFKDISACVALC